MSTRDILFERRGQIGLVTLNRPKALNALNADMCLALHQQLDAWGVDDSVKAVVVNGEGDKAFCAGGDVVSLYKSGMAYRDGDETSFEWRRFFWNEYRMNIAIQEFKKPYIALLDGITMGGGVGVSVHGSHRVATERTLLAMPETGIGMIPDVGGGWFLPRLPGETGMFLALTGDRLKAPGTMALGITSACIPSGRLDKLVDTLAKDASDIDGVLAGFHDDPGPSHLEPHQEAIDRIFSKESVEEILKALKDDGSEWSSTWRKRLLTKSPTSLKVTFRQMREGSTLENFRDNMKMEYRIVHRIIAGNDFYEGVRALLIEKDNAPKWRPGDLEGVADKDVAKYFESLGKGELSFD